MRQTRYGKFDKKDYDVGRYLEAECSRCGRKQGKRGKLRLFFKAWDTGTNFVGSQDELDCLCSKCFKVMFPKKPRS